MPSDPNPIPSAVPAYLLPLEKRDTWIAVWLKCGKRREPDGLGMPFLPGTRNTLDDLAQGYASLMGFPVDEVDPLYTDDSAYMGWVSRTFWPTIARHFSLSKT